MLRLADRLPTFDIFKYSCFNDLTFLPENDGVLWQLQLGDIIDLLNILIYV